MAKREVLARVEADLGRGHTHRAMQRLASLTTAYPDDLEVRAQRAALNRQIGNTSEAGRWGFLTEHVHPDELTAFERAFPTPGHRLVALRLGSDISGLVGPQARERLTKLLERADQASTRQPRSGATTRPNGEHGGWRHVVPCLVAAFGSLLLLGFAVVGLITVAGWLL